MGRGGRLLRRHRAVLLRVARRGRRRCPDCGVEMWSPAWGQPTGDHRRHATVDHIVPQALGGRHGYANLRVVCAQCNVAKGDRLRWGVLMLAVLRLAFGGRR